MMDCCLQVSSIHRIPQARILEWVAISIPGHHHHPGIKLRSPAFQVYPLPSEPPGTPIESNSSLQISSYHSRIQLVRT